MPTNVLRTCFAARRDRAISTTSSDPRSHNQPASLGEENVAVAAVSEPVSKSNLSVIDAMADRAESRPSVVARYNGNMMSRRSERDSSPSILSSPTATYFAPEVSPTPETSTSLITSRTFGVASKGSVTNVLAIDRLPDNDTLSGRPSTLPEIGTVTLVASGAAGAS